MRDDFAIRTATEADLPAVMCLVKACIEGMRERAIDQWDEVYPAHDNFLSDVAAGSLYVCAVGGDDVGAVFVLDDHQDPRWQVPWTIEDVRVAVVHRLMVHPRHQGRGLARALMEHAEDRARELGYGSIRLDAFSLNPQALTLYEHLGYRDAGTVVLRKGVFRCFEKRLP